MPAIGNKTQVALFDSYNKAQALALFPDKTSGTPQNFAAMPTVGGDPVVESGSNVDGAFTKWADGTLICIMTFTGYTTVQVDTTTSATFIAAPDSAPNSIFPGTSNDFGVSWGSSTTSVAFKSNQSYAANRVTLTAIGRWK
jgi:hypothetical protein